MYAGGGASLDIDGGHCSVLREHFLVRAQLSSSVEVRMPRTRLAACLAGAVIIALAGCGTGSGGGSNGDSASGPIQIWEGYTSTQGKAFAHLVAQYEKQTGQKISTLYVNSDNTLEKVLTAVRGGSPPDIAYLYGSWAPNVAQIPQVVNLTKVVQRPGVNWNDFWVGERAVATVNGKVIGIPALVDNLAVVYNKQMFAQAGLKPPGPDWTWSEFAADAKKLTNASAKQFGTAYVTPGTEDTVWHWEPLLWQAGGQLLNSDNTKAAFDSAAGLASLNTLRQMAVTDKSMYLDPSDSTYANLFNSGKIGMLVTGPWDLSQFTNIKYGVQVMPSYPGTSGGHQTISGPDNWVLFNNGPSRVSAAEKFILWLTAPAQDKYWALATGDLPIRASEGHSASFIQQLNNAQPGMAAFTANLANVKQARPQLTSYPKISQILGNMVVSVLLGKAEPKAALSAAAQQVNQVLATG
jgi:multiple sugar transport system substrate-binding protein